MRDLVENVEGRVSAAGFDIGVIRPIQPSGFRDLFLRQAELCSTRADGSPELDAQTVRWPTTT
jgi:hypothetical protein